MLNDRALVDRQIIAAVREHEQLSRKRFQIIKLDQPIQRGWRRTYVLAEHAKRRRDHETLEAILKVIGTTVVHPSRNFQFRRGRKKKLVEIEQSLQPISAHPWPAHPWPARLPEGWLIYFRYELLLERNRHSQPYWVFRQPSLYELKVERNWLWYFREVDPAIETRLSELDRWLTARQGWRRYHSLKGTSLYWYPSDRDRLLRRQELREMKEALDRYPEVDPTARRSCRAISLRSLPKIFPDVAQLAEAFRSERNQCGCDSCRRDHLRCRTPVRRALRLVTAARRTQAAFTLNP